MTDLQISPVLPHCKRRRWTWHRFMVFWH